MMIRNILLTCGTILCLAGSTAFAHEGHGNGLTGQGNDAVHYVTEPLHVAQIASIVLVLSCVAIFAVRRQIKASAAKGTVRK